MEISLKYEAIFLVISISISAILPKFDIISQELAWLISIEAILLVVACVIIKIHINKATGLIKPELLNSIERSNILTYKMARMPLYRIKYAKKVFDNAYKNILSIENGIIPLSESEYFHKIIEETKSLKESDSVIAVNSFDERRFQQDPRQIKYFEQNVKAISERNVKIKRIFIIDIKNLTDLMAKSGKNQFKKI